VVSVMQRNIDAIYIGVNTFVNYVKSCSMIKQVLLYYTININLLFCSLYCNLPCKITELAQMYKASMVHVAEKWPEKRGRE
jgi:hypothetical protein